MKLYAFNVNFNQFYFLEVVYTQFHLDKTV
jgi:hypothetical protein